MDSNIKLMGNFNMLFPYMFLANKISVCKTSEYMHHSRSSKCAGSAPQLICVQLVWVGSQTLLIYKKSTRRLQGAARVENH